MRGFIGFPSPLQIVIVLTFEKFNVLPHLSD